MEMNILKGKATGPLNLFIVDDNPMAITGLRNYLQNRFGLDLNIFTFLTGESAVKKVDKNTDIVILDYYLDDENGNDVLEAIKKVNPKTEVIMLSRNEDIRIAIDSFRKGASEYVVKGETAWKKIGYVVFRIVTYPVRVMVKEWGVNKYLAAFLVTFIAMAIVVLLAMRYITWNSNSPLH